MGLDPFPLPAVLEDPCACPQAVCSGVRLPRRCTSARQAATEQLAVPYKQLVCESHSHCSMSQRSSRREQSLAKDKDWEARDVLEQYPELSAEYRQVPPLAQQSLGAGLFQGQEQARSLLHVLGTLYKPGKPEAHHSSKLQQHRRKRGPWTQTCAHSAVSSGSSKAFGSCPVCSGTVRLGMPSPGPEQEKQVVHGHSELDVSDRDLTPRAVEKQRLGPSGRDSCNRPPPQTGSSRNSEQLKPPAAPAALWEERNEAERIQLRNCKKQPSSPKATVTLHIPPASAVNWQIVPVNFEENTSKEGSNQAPFRMWLFTPAVSFLKDSSVLFVCINP